MSSRFSSTLPTYYKSNSPQRPEGPGRSDSYDPAKMIPGAYPEDRHTTYHFTPHPEQQTTLKLKDALHQVQGEFTTVKRELPTLSKTTPDVVPLKSFGDMKLSDKPTTLPSALQNEYYSFSMFHDIDDDPLDLSEVVYVDSFEMVVPERCEEKRSLEIRDFEGDHAGNRARGEYVTGDGSTAVDRSYEEDDVAVGHGGVTYNRFGREGILPGYPTQEGMSKLIIDRMMDDQLGFAEVDNPTSSSVPAAISRSNNSSEGYPTSLPSSRNIDTRDSGSGSGKEIGKERTVPCLDFRILEERRESPIFETDRPTAPGKFEATPKFSTTPRSLLVVSSPKNDLAMRGYDSGSGLCEKKAGSREVKETPHFQD